MKGIFVARYSRRHLDIYYSSLLLVLLARVMIVMTIRILSN